MLSAEMMERIRKFFGPADSQAGYTLLELLVVIAAVIILIAIIIWR
jgi:prepilin-type N-terminal cleavage/methylation domain-containing protein